MIMRVNDANARRYYLTESNNIPQHLDFIKDPYVMEFLQLPEAVQLKESSLEQAIIDDLQKFLLEMGKGFSFVARQMRISTETTHFYIDLVFYRIFKMRNEVEHFENRLDQSLYPEKRIKFKIATTRFLRYDIL